MADTVAALVGDHAGFELKSSLTSMLNGHGDLWPEIAVAVDDPDMAAWP